MKILILAATLIFSTLILNSCKKDNITQTGDNTPPGRRDYQWSIDSVDYDSLPGMIELSSIWGSSPTDVWGAGFTEDVRNCFWHYDGTKWSRAVWNTPITEYGNGSKSVGGVWGTAQNDVWAFGGRLRSNPETIEPFIMHYDGSQWKEVTGDVTQMPIGFTDIYPIRKNHFWISSSDHVSEYKDGLWKKYSIAENYFIQSIEGIGGSVYLTAYPIGSDTLFLMEFHNDRFIVIDETNLWGSSKFEQNGLIFTSSKVFTFGGTGVVTSDISGEQIVKNWKNELYLAQGSGIWNSFKISSKDILGVGRPNLIEQFNGTDWKQLNLNTNTGGTLIGIWGNGDEIFVSDTENGTIFHGR